MNVFVLLICHYSFPYFTEHTLGKRTRHGSSTVHSVTSTLSSSMRLMPSASQGVGVQMGRAQFKLDTPLCLVYFKLDWTCEGGVQSFLESAKDLVQDRL